MQIDIPGYKIVKKIGEGGMASVYMAIQENFDRHVALKIMSRHLSHDTIFGERFLREAKIVAALIHQNIVTVYDVGIHQDHHYLAMEYLPGGNLKSRLQVNDSSIFALNVIYEIASALAYAHSKHYIHRDVKSENILFREDGTAVLTDFGIARVAGQSDKNVTTTGMIIGSPQYMSPEQALAKTIDHRADIYSLGVVFYETLAGKPMYESESSIAAAIQHISQPIPSLPLPYQHLQATFEKMVAKEPEDRFENADEILDVLEPFLNTPTHSQEFDQAGAQYQETDGGTRIISRQFASSNSLSSRQNSGLRIRTTQSGHKNSQVSIENIASKTSSNRIKLRKLASKLSTPASLATLALVIVGVAVLLVVLSQIRNPEPNPEVSPAQQQIDMLTAKALVAEKESRWEEAHSLYNTILALNVNDQGSIEGLKKITGIYLDKATQAMRESENLGQAKRFLNKAIEIFPTHPKIAIVQREMQKLISNISAKEAVRIKKQKEIISLIEKANSAIKNKNYLQPTNESAKDYFNKVLELDKNNQQALNGLRALADIYLQKTDSEITNTNLVVAESNWQIAKIIFPEHPSLTTYKDRIIAQKKAKTEQLKQIEKIENDIANLLELAKIDINLEKYTEPKSDNALSKYQKVLSLDEENTEAQKGILIIAQNLTEAITHHVENKNLTAARDQFNILEKMSPSQELTNKAHTTIDKLAELLDNERQQADEIKALLTKSDKLLKKEPLTFNKLVEAFEYCQGALNIDSNSIKAKELIKKIENYAIALSNQAIQRANYPLADKYISWLTEISATSTNIETLGPLIAATEENLKLTRQEESDQSRRKIETLLLEANRALTRKRLTSPKGSSAYDKYIAVLKVEEKNKAALNGLGKIAIEYINLASKATNKNDLKGARNYINRGYSIIKNRNVPSKYFESIKKTSESLERLVYIEQVEKPLKLIRNWNTTLAQGKEHSVQSLNEAHNTYINLIKRKIENEQLAKAKIIYPETFFRVGRDYFYKKDMDTSKILIDKGLDINPKHARLLQLQNRWQKRKDGKESLFDILF